MFWAMLKMYFNRWSTTLQKIEQILQLLTLLPTMESSSLHNKSGIWNRFIYVTASISSKNSQRKIFLSKICSLSSGVSFHHQQCRRVNQGSYMSLEYPEMSVWSWVCFALVCPYILYSPGKWKISLNKPSDFPHQKKILLLLVHLTILRVYNLTFSENEKIIF